MQIITLEPNQFDAFSKNHKYRNYYQTSFYGKTMAENGFKTHYLGIKDDAGNLIGASLIIYKDVFMGQKIAYAPRGILFEYTQEEEVKELSQKLKQVLGKQGFLILRINPYIPATIKNVKGTTLTINNEVNTIMQNLKQADFKYKGQNKYFENELPRFEAIYLLNEDKETLWKNLTKRTRHKINRALGFGITVFNDKEKNTKVLYDFCKNKTDLSPKYINDLVKNFPDSNIYYALLNTDSFVIEAKKRYENELEKNNILAKKIQDQRTKNSNVRKKHLNSKMESDKLINIYKNDLILATELLKKYPKGFVIGAALTIEYNNASYLIIDGFDEKYKRLNCNYLLKWYIINECKKKGLKYLNLNAIVGEFKKKNPYQQLNEMKLGFNPIPTEYIGEFELVLNNFTYTIYKGFNKDNKYIVKGESK